MKIIADRYEVVGEVLDGDAARELADAIDAQMYHGAAMQVRYMVHIAVRAALPRDRGAAHGAQLGFGGSTSRTRCRGDPAMRLGARK